MSWIRRGYATWRRWPIWGRVATVAVLGAALLGPFIRDDESDNPDAPVADAQAVDAPTSTTIVVAATVGATDGLFGVDLVGRICSECHGSDLGGGKGPPLSRGSNAATNVTDEQIADVLDIGTEGMPSFEGLSDEQVASVIAYLRSVQAGEVATATSIIDGDTLEVTIDGGGVDTVRLIGINAPEEGECGHRQATTFLAMRLVADPFTTTADVSDRDQYDRLLRYLWLSDGTFVNEWMVRSGFAIAHDYPPDSAYADRLAAAQTEAEAEQVGMWAPDWCGPEATGDVVISDVHFDAAGNDHENKNDEWVEVANTGITSAAMSGWVLKDESSTHRFHFPPGFTLASGTKVRIYTGCGTQIETELYWCNNSAVWDNDGDTAFILDAAGNVVDSRSY